jgi:hypothetical protein
MLENYLYDPFVVFGILAAREEQPLIDGLPERLTEREIRDLPSSNKQAVVDYMLGQLASHLGDEIVQNTEQVPVNFVDGPPVRYPRWFLEAPGKRLLPPGYTQSFPGGVRREELWSMYWRVRMIPIDLAEMIRNIQNPSI